MSAGYGGLQPYWSFLVTYDFTRRVALQLAGGALLAGFAPGAALALSTSNSRSWIPDARKEDMVRAAV